MLTLTTKDIDRILRDYGISGTCAELTELQRYDYEENDPAAKEVRLIVKAVLDDGRRLVVRAKKEEDAPLERIEDQSRFAAALAAHGIETPRVYASDGRYARWYGIGGYDVIVTVEDFADGQLQTVDLETARKTGRLLARMHTIAEAGDLHVRGGVLFDPLRENDLFRFETIVEHRDALAAVDAELYESIV